MLKNIARRSKTKESGLTIFRAKITFFLLLSIGQKRSNQSNIDAADVMNVVIPKRRKFAGM